MRLFVSCLFLPLLAAGLQVHRECRKEGNIAFTFDQGPSQYTGILLTALAKANVKATFHVVPDYLDNPVLSANLRRAAVEGHLIGLFVKESVTEDKVKAYLDSASNALKQYINYKPTFLRFTASPGPSERMLKIVEGLGYTVTSYNLDSQDYGYANETTEANGEGSVYRTIRGVLDMIVPPTLGSFICVQRDIVQASVLQMPAILRYVKGRGYKAVKLDECLQMGSGRDSGAGAGGSEADGGADGRVNSGDTDGRDSSLRGQSENAASRMVPTHSFAMMVFHMVLSLLL